MVAPSGDDFAEALAGGAPAPGARFGEGSGGIRPQKNRRFLVHGHPNMQGFGVGKFSPCGHGANSSGSILGWMNIHLPPVLMFTRGTGF